MKLFLIAALFLTAFVVVPSLAEDDQDSTKNVADTPEASEVKNDEAPTVATEGDEVKSEEEETNKDMKKEIPEEFQDEVERAKRGIPQLSLHCCRILKRYGYCNNAGIRRFCHSVCCANIISHQSCRKVKITLRHCNHHIGRVYCRHTCGHCLPPQCRNYRLLTDKTRRQSVQIGPIKCDRSLPTRWYRFSPNRVNGQGSIIPRRCTRINRCGTSATGWMVGSLPPVGKNYVRKVCYHWSGNCCKFHNYIRVTHCRHFFVYYLTKPPACNLRYCGNY